MSFVEILLIGIGLSMDAFSVSISKGLTTKKFSWKVALTCGLWFGVFQALMPIIGYFLGAQFEQFITSVDHWIAFGLLFLIGANLIREALSKKTENGERRTENLPLSTFRSQLQMFPLAIATSIDALAVGISFACIQVQLWSSVLIIGVTTFLFSVLGVKIGNVFGSRFEKGAGVLGGIILILIGLKILLEHLGVMSF
ncbi:MAG: manganese efflux pump [Bacteroidales bacterium]|nr:manganese efflux pump [Bacteroidales bacterium]MBR6272341.1 manganese efflux pump [Bacteroidales bacterium]